MSAMFSLPLFQDSIFANILRYALGHTFLIGIGFCVVYFSAAWFHALLNEVLPIIDSTLIVRQMSHESMCLTERGSIDG